LNFTAFAALAIFVGTLVLMIRRPRGIRLGYVAGIGAAFSLLLGTVTLGQAAQSFLDIWDAALAFIGIVALSVTLDAMGFFKWAAIRVVKLAGGSGLRLYFYVSLLTAAVSILFANDSAVLILTPIVLEIVIQLKIDAKGRLAYLFSAGLIADTAAMPSNPINILSADFFKYTFIDHLIFMGPIAIATIASSILLVYVFFRKKIPKIYDVGAVDALTLGKQPISSGLLKVCLATLVTIDVGYVVASLSKIPVSLVICSGTVFLVIVYWFTLKHASGVEGEKKGLKGLANEINWDIILFMLCIFIVVQGLETAGVVEFLASTFVSASALPSVLGVFVPSLIVTVGASFMNNWPMTILGMFSIKQAIIAAGLGGQAVAGLIFSNVIGNNLGPHFFPLGSLAILMWLECMRRKGVQISLKEYLKVGAVLSIVEVAVASLILWAELSMGFRLGI
jgi:arsenical pump membrane protein